VKVLFISANRSEVNMRSIPLGLACVASSVQQAGHTVRMLDLLQAADPPLALAEVIGGFHPDAIAVSIRNIDDQDMRAPRFFLEDDRLVVEQAKLLSSAPVILGGAGYSIFPEAVLAYTGADMGIQGEGEGALPRLLDRLRDSRSLDGVPGLYIRGKGLHGPRTFVKELDRFPLPSAELIGAGGNVADTWIPVQTRRGCPMKCIYCSTAAIEGMRVRRRSIEKVLEWMGVLRSEGFRQFYFVDNTFNLPVSYARALSDRLIHASLDASWRCIVYPWKMDALLASAMAEAGCVEASVGFETGSQHLMAGMNKRFKRQDVQETCALLRRYGIRVMGFLLLGGPGETRESVEESLAFAESLDLDLLKITVGIRIYPDTVLADLARKEGIIAPDDNLLLPKFYLTRGLEEWLPGKIEEYAHNRPNWIV
jgi:radical SAM superfamily enzyme YgiQ (UPF0313 family)